MVAAATTRAVADGRITSVEEAIKLVAEPGFRAGLGATLPTLGPRGRRFRYPFGIWFRGERLLQTATGGRLETMPSVLRTQRPGPGRQLEPQYCDEASMFYHFQLREPEYGQNLRSILDWLCLMQHYGLPTRLLDWTENVLVALYFAAEDESCWGQPGKLLALNAHHLNALTGLAARPGESGRVGIPGDFDTAVRALLAVSRDVDRLREQLRMLPQGADWGPDPAGRLLDRLEQGDPATLQKLAAPWAVLPTWLNRRIVQQTGTFTISGGKVYDPALVANGEPADRMIPLPLSFEALRDSLAGDNATEAGQGCHEPQRASFLQVYEVDGEAKATIKEHLCWLGIHEGTLFPELDHQARYIRDRWLWHGDDASRQGLEPPPARRPAPRGDPAE